MLDARLAADGERPQHRPAEQHAARPERQRDGDIEPAPDAAVDPYLGPAGDRRRDLGEDVGRRLDAIELPGAVVADDDPVDARARPRAAHPRR